jgi:hypothetical protein
MLSKTNPDSDKYHIFSHMWRKKMDLNINGGLLGKGNQKDVGGRKERMTAGDNDQSTLHAYVKGS